MSFVGTNGLRLSATDRVGRLESIKTWAKVLLVLDLFMGFVGNDKNVDFHQPYLLMKGTFLQGTLHR